MRASSPTPLLSHKGVTRVFDMFSQSYRFVDDLGQPWSSILKIVLVVILLGFLAIKTFKFVPQGSEALKLRCGKVVFRPSKETGQLEPVVKGPGLKVMIPFFHSLEVVSVLQRQINLTPDHPFYVPFRDKKGGMHLQVLATVNVRQIYKWRYINEDIEDIVRTKLQTLLLSAVTNYDPVRIQQDAFGVRNELIQQHKALIDQELSSVGGELDQINFGNLWLDPTFAVAHAIEASGYTTKYPPVL